MSDFDIISDLFKDATGFRPSVEWLRQFHTAEFSEQERIFTDLVEELGRVERERAAEAQVALSDYQARLEGMAKDYNLSLATAMRWDMEGFDVDVHAALAMHGCAIQEIEMYLFNQGIEFSEFPYYVELACEAFGLTKYATTKE